MNKFFFSFFLFYFILYYIFFLKKKKCVLFINNNAIIEWNDILESISTIIRSYATYALSIILIINIICGYFTVNIKHIEKEMNK